MSKLIYHSGTGTYFDVNDDVFVIDARKLSDDERKALDDGDDSILDFVIEDGRGKPLFVSDMTWGNTVSYSPSSIREEIRESLYEKYPDDEPVLEWAMTASDDELNSVAGYIMNASDIWDSFITNLIDGLREGYRWSLDKRDKA